jgi:hypothetical protein
MANGSGHEGPARGDRYREKYARMHKRTQAKLDKVPISRDLPAYREEMDSHSEVTLGYGDKLKATVKVPGKGLLIVLAILAVGAVAVAVLKALG